MGEICLQWKATGGSEACGVCGEESPFPAGHRLSLAQTGEPVCVGCGLKHEPALVALVRLASSALRISQMRRHSVFPPLTALLDLAQAADSYTHSAEAAAPAHPV